MFNRNQAVDLLKQQVNLLDLFERLGGRPLRRQGQRVTARCFNEKAHRHGDAKPSLSLDVAKGLYHCFGCGAKGDAISLFQALGGPADFSDACAELAIRYAPSLETHFKKGIRTLQAAPPLASKPVFSAISPDIGPGAAPGTLPLMGAEGGRKTVSSAGIGLGYGKAGGRLSAPARQTRAPLAEASYQPAGAAFATVYEAFRSLCVLGNGDRALLDSGWNYLAGRGFSQQTILRFGWFEVGDYTAISRELAACFPLSELLEAGLFNTKGNLVFFRHRLVLPFYLDGRIVYLQARALEPGSEPKYLNLRSGAGEEAAVLPFPLFNAGRLAKPSENTLYVAEGCYNAIALEQAGAEAVAIGSAANFRRFAGEWLPLFAGRSLCLALDNDAAGQRAAQEIARTLVMHTGTLPVLLGLPPGQDVNDYLKAAWQAAGGTPEAVPSDPLCYALDAEEAAAFLNKLPKRGQPVPP